MRLEEKEGTVLVTIRREIRSNWRGEEIRWVQQCATPGLSQRPRIDAFQVHLTVQDEGF